MTNEQAKAIFLLEYCSQRCGTQYRRHCDNCEINLAIEALEKQMPKKSIWEHLGDSLSNADIITMCPSCYKGIEEDEQHCECGQAIDWSEEE